MAPRVQHNPIAETRSAWMRRGVVALAVALAGVSCVGSGSEVGVFLKPVAEQSVQGVVLDPAGNPISNVEVTFNGNRVLTDTHGRYRFGEETVHSGVLTVDGRRTTTKSGGVFDVLGAAIEFDGTFAVPPRPIVLPDFHAGASTAISVNQGQVLAGTLTDPATGAQLVLNGAVATQTGTATTATLRFVSVPADSISAPLTPGGQLRAGALYFSIAPANVTFTSAPLVRVGNAIFGIADALAASKPVTPELDRLDPVGGAWQLEGSASTAGGFLSSGALTRGGFYCLSVASPQSRRTIATARVTQLRFDPQPKAAVLSRDGRATSTDSHGLAGIQDVTAADANDQPIAVPLTIVPPAFFALPAFRRDVLPGVAGPGQITEFGDRPIATVPAGRVRVQPVFRGLTLEGARVGVSAVDDRFADFGGVSTKAGAEFWDVPTGRFVASTSGIGLENQTVRSSRLGALHQAGTTTTIQLFPQPSARIGKPHLGRVVESALRAKSFTPVFGIYDLLGIDGNVAQQGFSPFGVGRYQPVLPGPALTSAGHQIDAPAFGLKSGGLDVDRVRHTGYASQMSAARQRRIALVDSIVLRAGDYVQGAAVSGAAAGLTDPSGVPPSNGAYAAEIRAQSAASFEKRIAIAFGAESIPAEDVPPATPPAFAANAYSAFAPIGTSLIAAVERDGSSASAPITRVGVSAAFDVKASAEATLDLTLDLQPTSTLLASLQGFAGDPSALAVRLILGFADGRAADAGAQGAFSYNSGTGALSVAIPPLAAVRSAAVISCPSTAANGSAGSAAAVAFSDVAEPVLFLAVPHLDAPAPAPGDSILLSPTDGGFTWTADANADETYISATRDDVGPDPSGKIVQEQQSWRVRLPGAPSNFTFPRLASFVNSNAIPQFFQKGKRYTLTIEVRKYAAGVYEERLLATSPDVALPSELGLRALSRTTVDFVVQ